MRGLASAALVLLCVSACTTRAGASGGALNPTGDLPSEPATAASAAVAAPAAVASASRDVLAQYRRFHQVTEKALATGDVSELPSVATGAEAAYLRREIAGDQRAGVVLRGHAVPHPRLTAVRPSSAQLVDCITAAGPYAFRRDSGKRVGSAAKPRRYLLYATMALADGTWKVASLATPKDARC